MYAAAVAVWTLGEPGALLALPAAELVRVLAHGPDREVHAALPVDLGDLDLHVLADLHGVRDVADAVVRDL